MANPINKELAFDLWNRIDTGSALFNAINRLSPFMAYLLATLVLMVIGAVDYHTHIELALAPLYAVSCFLVDWRIGRTPALVYGGFATAVQWGIGTFGTHNYSHDYYLYLGITVNFAFYGALIWIVAKLRLALEMEQVLSRMDFLTRMANRKTFLELLEAELRSQHGVGGVLMVLSVNLDRFSSFNQEEGYTVGDLALAAVADVVRRGARKTDLVGRTDNAEFSIARLEDTAGGFEASMKSLASQMEMLMLSRGWRLTYSVACASFEAPPESGNAVMGKVRVVLGEAKQLGKNKSLRRNWGKDGKVTGQPMMEVGPFMDFEKTGQMYVEPGQNPW
jgi:diguanylate cyclase (GGDEF)-like protein